MCQAMKRFEDIVSLLRRGLQTSGKANQSESE